MALSAPTVLASNTLAVAASSSGNTASISPTANVPVFIQTLVPTEFGGTAPIATPSGCNLTWSELHVAGGVLDPDADSRLQVWSGIGSAPTSGVVNIALGAGDVGGLIGYSIVEQVGAASTGFVVTTASGTFSGSPTAFNITMPALSASGNGTLGFFGGWLFASQYPCYVAKSGYTEIADIGTDASPRFEQSVVYAIPGTTSPGMTSAEDFIRIAGIAVEVKAAVAGSLCPVRAFPRSVLMH